MVSITSPYLRQDDYEHISQLTFLDFRRKRDVYIIKELHHQTIQTIPMVG